MKTYKDDQVVTVGILKDILQHELKCVMQHITSVEERLDSRIDVLEYKMDRKFEEVDARFDLIDEKLQKNLDQHDLFIQRIEAIAQEQEMRLAAYRRLEERTTKLEAATFG